MEAGIQELVRGAARHLLNSRHAIALTGAGISTESGIPDFRGASGIWTRDPDAERRAYRTYDRFIKDPKAWWEETLRGPAASGSGPAGVGLGNLWEARPNEGHLALVALEALGILKCVITQNIDALHQKAGTKCLLEYHGSFMKLRCVTCGSRFWREEFDLQELAGRGALPPLCHLCMGVLKPDTVSFGEPIPRDVAGESLDEAQKCDLMLVCGTSAVVYPFAGLPAVAKERAGVTVIEINAEPTPLTHDGISDHFIRGKTGEILPAIVAEVRRAVADGPQGRD